MDEKRVGVVGGREGGRERVKGGGERREGRSLHALFACEMKWNGLGSAGRCAADM